MWLGAFMTPQLSYGSPALGLIFACVVRLAHRSSKRLARRSGGILHAGLEHLEVEYFKSDKCGRIRRISGFWNFFFCCAIFYFQLLRFDRQCESTFPVQALAHSNWPEEVRERYNLYWFFCTVLHSVCYNIFVQ